jgi:16S rRNA G966 N2-methylase RsmD
MEHGHALDLFSGVGSLGIEALSRGLTHCTFVERHAPIRALLEANLQSLGLLRRSTVLKGDALSMNWHAVLPHRPLLVVFCDPPYPLLREDGGLERITQLIRSLRPHLEPGGAVMLRTEMRFVPQPIPGYRPPSSYAYGSMMLNFWQAPRPGEPSTPEVTPQVTPQAIPEINPDSANRASNPVGSG